MALKLLQQEYFSRTFMKTKITLDSVYKVSNDVVMREVEDVIIIIPIEFDTDDTKNEPYILNMTGHAIWQKFNGKRSLKDIVADLSAEFKVPGKDIEKDVIGFVRKLLDKKFLVKIS
jgi:hypothetical protein